MKGRTIVVSMASVLLLASGSAHALDSGFYVGLNIGQADQDLENIEATPRPELTYTEDIDSIDTAYGIFGGYQFGRWFAVEGAFNHLGTSEIDHSFRYEDPQITIESQGSVEAKTNAFSVAGLLTIPLGDAFSIGLRAGVAYSNVEFDSTVDFYRINGEASPVGRSSDSDNIAPTFGANAEYAITPGVSLRADWQRFNEVGDGSDGRFDGYDIDLLTLSVVGRF